MELLLLSNSRNPGGEYLQHALPAFEKLSQGRKRAVFIPFAGVTMSWDSYRDTVQQALAPLGIEVRGIHEFDDTIVAIEEAELILVGGGTSWRLLQLMREWGLLEPIRAAVKRGTPYVGWSAGTNMSCPTLRTTNDMPIVDPQGFDALGLIPFQINPHYNNELPPGHQGETRDQRIAEFLVVNPEVRVLGIPEGDWLEVTDERVLLVGPKPARLFVANEPLVDLPAGDITARVGQAVTA